MNGETQAEPVNDDGQAEPIDGKAAPESTSSRGAPIGRRVFLSLFGLGAAGVVVGAKVQDWVGNVLAPLEAKDFTGLSSLLPFGQFRYYSITGSFPSRARSKYLSLIHI